MKRNGNGRGKALFGNDGGIIYAGGSPLKKPPGLDERLGVDLYRLVAEKAEEQGRSVEEVIWAVFRSLLSQALGGDVRAAKEVLDRLCEKPSEKAAVEVNIDARSATIGPPAPSSKEELVGYLEKIANDWDVGKPRRREKNDEDFFS